MYGRAPRMSGRREIRLPISVTAAIDFQFTALMKPDNQQGRTFAGSH
jgi:hypothetical protein